MYKVFYNNSVIVIGEKLTKNESALQNVQLLNKMELNNFLNDFLTTENPHDFFLNGYNSEDLFEDLKTNFQFIEAAGGIVQNNLQDYLFIKRFGIWDLPKGKMKKNELPEKAAIREVEEETGVKILSIIRLQVGSDVRSQNLIPPVGLIPRYLHRKIIGFRFTPRMLASR